MGDEIKRTKIQKMGDSFVFTGSESKSPDQELKDKLFGLDAVEVKLRKEQEEVMKNAIMKEIEELHTYQLNKSFQETLRKVQEKDRENQEESRNFFDPFAKKKEREVPNDMFYRGEGGLKSTTLSDLPFDKLFKLTLSSFNSCLPAHLQVLDEGRIPFPYVGVPNDAKKMQLRIMFKVLERRSGERDVTDEHLEMMIRMVRAVKEYL